MDLKSINQKAYLHFDTVNVDHIYMLALIAPSLSHINTIKLKKEFQDIFLKLKQGIEVNLGKYWNKFNLILNPTN